VVSEMNHERLGEEGDKHWEGAKAWKEKCQRK
jgi:hypothetical protein